ncbi:ABC transporter permease [Mesorhizobium sp.]|uniref:ABC transporter permease n=1 Tax=Mesorhizobium sp. TaxID=1871066 RepID=UPI000FE777BF|nr:ABC transporter permease [Mesorhizobium sp.]RWG06086.1 MAG: ABC transporter permease [Mesorhizobium sp.]RWG97563.1 MAG: ABC transporter permease [Mesorhizobium sp.]RWI16556.1 MAG: ABC transporter permease [Mesorhizobium sp.]RWN07625.1 MAG: ABC transporter permease [Mesorhizobium sp.]RWN12456.1 MAG: ABC transporter permease [Mesorhizobium sp.]
MSAITVTKRSLFWGGPTSSREYGQALSLLLVAPLLLLLCTAFLYPLAGLFWGSVFAPEATLKHYLRVLQEPLYLLILWRTFELAFIVTVLALLLGYPVALAMARVSGRAAMLIGACVLIPLWTSVLVRSYAWIVLLQRNGLVNTSLHEAGLIEAPLQLLYTQGAVVVAMTQVLLPFMVLPIYSVVRSIPDDLTRAARNLGAGGLQAFLRVTLPLSLPGVSAGVLITFILSLGFYITPALVGGPRTLMMSTLIGQQTTELLNWSFAGALSAVLLLTTLFLVVVFRRTLALNRGLKLG